jgi:hypothetical protein
LIRLNKNRIELSISGCGVAAGFLATAQPPFSHKHRKHRLRNTYQGFSPLHLSALLNSR